MADERGVVKEIAWSEIFPWLMIFRSFAIAISLPVWLLATLGVLITPLGWVCGEKLFLSQEEINSTSAFRMMVENNSSWPSQDGSVENPSIARFPQPLNHFFSPTAGGVNSTFGKFAEPFQMLFHLKISPTQFAYFLFGGIWTLGVWSLMGGAITRIAAVRLGREERVGLMQAVSFARRNYLSYFFTPLYPLLGVALISCFIAALGWMMWLGDIGFLLGGAAWPLALLGGLVITLMLLGLLFGWPLMWGAVSSEGGDSFDAWSRSYSFTYQRPLHYLFYAFIAVAFGALCWVLIHTMSEAVISLTLWASSWGMGAERIEDIENASISGDATGFFGLGISLYSLSVSFVRIIASSFKYGFFWCAATAVYLLLRRSLFQTEFDEIHVEDEVVQYDLPSFSSDKKGPSAGNESASQKEEQASPSKSASEPSSGETPSSPSDDSSLSSDE